MAVSDLIRVLLPHLAGVGIGRVEDRGALVRVMTSSIQASACCPSCGYDSSTVHSGYERSIADIAVGGRRLVIGLTVRGFFCHDPTCPKKTFAEQVPGRTYR
jgi:transposase